MKFNRGNYPLLFVALTLAPFLAFSLFAQSPPPTPTRAPSNSTAANLVTPPLPPTAKSPVDTFRELLAMNLAERKQFLADRSPENRRQILAKLRQYEAIRPDERELRLKVTELRWFLLPLLRTPATNRLEQLASIPKEDRQLIEDRLQVWDILPADLQKQLLDNEATMRYLCELGIQNTNISSALASHVNQGLEFWQNLPQGQKQKLLNGFNQMFGLTDREKDRVLKTLSEPERQQIEKTLRKFGTLSPEQRAECIRSFEKFANLSFEDRLQFLRNADRWKLMSPDERQQWKDVVQKLTPQPPLPPGLGQPPPPPPPGFPHRTVPLATNGN
jgi:hypothetical protein